MHQVATAVLYTDSGNISPGTDGSQTERSSRELMGLAGQRNPVKQGKIWLNPVCWYESPVVVVDMAHAELELKRFRFAISNQNRSTSVAAGSSLGLLNSDESSDLLLAYYAITTP